ncbi:MAG: hypothetical protein A2521_06310 [Deltaproteobacteria bacterium RIFOXYD12_FULL_57_12]|nr:MAG: hypothetical protein A2521_06310 [Deltaproteobacteria bacterium RIFOXYD12_FULL_57_12]
MGSIHQLPLAKLAENLSVQLGIQDFVETGTYLGGSLEWGSRTFERVTTIELRQDYHAAARARLTHLTNVDFRLGDSALELKSVCETIKGPTLFWLDAHAGAGFFGQDDICPLLTELEIITCRKKDDVIFVDDVRAFLAPPPPPFDYSKWPTLDEVMRVVLRRNTTHTVVINDTLIIAPRKVRETLAQLVFSIRPKI